MAGLLALLRVLASIRTTLRRRMPRWAILALPWAPLPQSLWPVFLPAYSRIVPPIPTGLRAPYGGVFDRPWILIALLLPAACLLLIRPARVFCVSTVDLSHFKRRFSPMSDSIV